jgi:hypothetical protein
VKKGKDDREEKNGKDKKESQAEKDGINPEKSKERTPSAKTPATASETSEGGQTEKIRAAGEGYGSSRSAALSSSSEAYEAAKIDQTQSRYDRDVSRQINNDQQQVANYAEPLLASRNPSDRAKGEQFLAQSSAPPEKFQEVYQGLHLSTNRDLLEHGPEVSKNLEQAGDNWQKAGDEWKSDGDKAQAAAAQMKAMENNLAQSGQKLSSITQDPSSGVRAGSNTNNLILNTGSGGTGAGGDSSLSASAANQRLSDPAAREGGATASTLGRKPSGSRSSPSDLGASSFRDQLRSRLLTGQNSALAVNGAQAADPTPKSAFDSLFEHRSPASKSDEETAAESAAAANRARAFSMPGSDTDAAVKKLVRKLDDAGSTLGSDEQVFGNPEITIFARMKTYLTKAQADKKVAR